MKIVVKILQDGNEVLSKELDTGTFILGRGAGCDLPVEDQAISRKHVEVRVSESAIYVTNLSTSSKLLFDGKAVETAELNLGDDFSVGPYQVLIISPSQAEWSQASEVADPGMGDALPEASPETPEPEAAPDPFGELPNNESEDGGFAEAPDFAPLDDPFAENPGDIPGGDPIEEPAGQGEDLAAGGEGTSMGETQVFSKPLVAKIIFEAGPKKGEELFVETYEVTLGRSKKADIFINDEKLSRVHAKVTRMGMGYRLVDLNSRNGTYVNGMRVLEHPLNSFDVVTLGNTKFKFLIHDMLAHERTSHTGAAGRDQTRSVMMTPSRKVQLVELQKQMPPEVRKKSTAAKSRWDAIPKRTKMLAGALIILGGLYFVIPGEKPKAPAPQVATKTEEPAPVAAEPQAEKTPKRQVALPPSMPQEFHDLSPNKQRELEGHYQQAIRSASRELYDEARFYMRKVHELVPYYKNSRELATKYAKELRAKQIAIAEANARRNEKNDIKIYLDEGFGFLRRGKFSRAAEAFNSAIALDPRNTQALKGLKAAEAKVRSLSELRPKKDPNVDRVIKLFQKAVAAFANKSYSEAIQTAEEIRTIKLKDTKYLSEAKQIIDRARMLQKEEFEPFLIQAKEKYAEADYNASRDLCEEMVKRDPAYGEAKECLKKAKRQLNRLAKEAYVHGYILESMNKIEEAKQYWLRAKNYVRKGDKYYNKVLKKLEFYQ